MGTLDEVKENISVANETPPDSIPEVELKLYQEVKQVYEKEIKGELHYMWLLPTLPPECGYTSMLHLIESETYV